MIEPNDARVSAGSFAPGAAPRVTEEDVKAAIKEEVFVVMPDGRTTICQLTLVNGFTVRGESSCVYIENFDAEVGKDIARKQATNKVWQLEAYLLAQRRHEESLRYAGN